MTKQDFTLRLAEAMAQVTALKLLANNSTAQAKLEALFIELGAIATLFNATVLEDGDTVEPVKPHIEVAEGSYFHELADQIVKAGLHGVDSLMIATREGFPAVIVATQEHGISGWIQDGKLEALKQTFGEELDTGVGEVQKADKG